MKTAVTTKSGFMARPVVPFPNSVSRRQLLHKILDVILVAPSGMGIAVTLLVLLVII